MPLLDISGNNRFPAAGTVLKRPLPSGYSHPLANGFNGTAVEFGTVFNEAGAQFQTKGIQPGDTLYIVSAAVGVPAAFVVTLVPTQDALFVLPAFPTDYITSVWKVGLGTPFTIPTFGQFIENRNTIPYSVHHAAVWIDDDISNYYGDERGPNNLIWENP